mgnify:CR=1 FL=1
MLVQVWRRCWLATHTLRKRGRVCSGMTWKVPRCMLVPLCSKHQLHTPCVGFCCVCECACARGYEYRDVNATHKACFPCAEGFYKDTISNAQACEACPSDRTSLVTGGTSVTNCKCNAGTAPSAQVHTSLEITASNYGTLDTKTLHQDVTVNVWFDSSITWSHLIMR